MKGPRQVELLSSPSLLRRAYDRFLPPLQPPASALTATDTEGVPVRSQSPRAAEVDEQMKASALFGAGWEDDSLEVLWRDADRAFCRLRRDVADGDMHAYIPIGYGAEHPTIERLNRLTHE